MKQKLWDLMKQPMAKEDLIYKNLSGGCSMKKLVGTLLAAGLLTGSTLAAEVNVKLPVDVHGGFSAGYSYADSTAEGFEVTNFLVELSKEAKAGDIGFTAAFGYLPSNGASTTGDNFGFQYGYLSIVPMDGITLDAGVLATNVGYEVANTYANPNITIARIWGGQPVYYGGARLTATVSEGIDVYAEVNDDDTDGAWAVGSLGSLGIVDYVISYYDKNNPNSADIVDVILSTSASESLDMAVNFDYQIGKNKNGYGVAFYLTPKFGNISLPVRVESFDDKGSGAYGGNKGWDLAITPTYKFKSGYLRAEVLYYDYDNPEKVVGSKAAAGYADKSNTVFRLEAGFTF